MPASLTLSTAFVLSNAGGASGPIDDIDDIDDIDYIDLVAASGTQASPDSLAPGRRG